MTVDVQFTDNSLDDFPRPQPLQNANAVNFAAVKIAYEYATLGLVNIRNIDVSLFSWL